MTSLTTTTSTMTYYVIERLVSGRGVERVELTVAVWTFRQLTPSSSSNYTINLSGLLMLGLGVAAATMFWAHVTTLSGRKFDKVTTFQFQFFQPKLHLIRYRT